MFTGSVTGCWLSLFSNSTHRGSWLVPTIDLQDTEGIRDGFMQLCVAFVGALLMDKCMRLSLAAIACSHLIRIVDEVAVVTHEYQPSLLRSKQVLVTYPPPLIFSLFCCLMHLFYIISPQAMLMRQQGRLDGRVQNIDEQLTKLESDKTLMKVQ